MKKKVLLPIITFSLICLFIILIGLWGSNGGFLAFLKGQFDFGPDLHAIRYSVHKEHRNFYDVTVTIPNKSPIHEISPEYLSFAIDTSQVVGGKWWNPRAEKKEVGSGTYHAPVFNFNQKKLDNFIQPLLPAYLRIGGSEADKVFYDLENASQLNKNIPKGYESVLTKSQWDNLNAFVLRNKLKFVFTLNAGPSSRIENGKWNSENAAQLLKYSASKNYRIDVWELGNEVNLFWYLYGPSKKVSADVYLSDVNELKSLLQNYYPNSLFAGQGSAFWPIFGEPLAFFFAFTPDYIQKVSDKIDIISWHYYPQQGRRGPIASRRATPTRLLEKENLNEVAYWGDSIQKLAFKNGSMRPFWIGETGNAQFGGEPGVSDKYIGGLWWLDQLGLMAVHKHSVIIRQSLTGMNYGLLDSDTLEPRPDYFNSVLWKKIMGKSVLLASTKGDNQNKIRVYVHTENGHLQFLILNLDHKRSARVTIPEIEKSMTVFILETNDLFGGKLQLNGKELNISSDGVLSSMQGLKLDISKKPLLLKPLSYAFLKTD